MTEKTRGMGEKPHEMCEKPHGMCEKPHGMCEKPHGMCEKPHGMCEKPHGMFRGPPMMLQPNKRAPEFAGTAVIDGEFKPIKLEDYKGKYIVLVFYPLDFTFVCPTEVIAFSDALAEFEQRNAVVIACSTDSVYAHLQWTKMDRKQGGLGKINIPLLSDKNMRISRAYGVLDEEEGHAFRGLFIIDPKGILRQITINDRPIGRSVDETLRLLDAFIFHEKNGEVCPANWKPKDKTIKPDPVGAQAYFSST